MAKRRSDFARTRGDSEYGGGPGLVQPALAPDGSPGHTPTASEGSAALRAEPATDDAGDAA